MHYNVNNSFQFLKSKKFFSYCVFLLKNGNLKLLPDLVVDLWLLAYIKFVDKINQSITNKYIMYVCILNPNSFKRLLSINIVYGLREYFQKINDFYLKLNSPTADEFVKLLQNEEVIDEIKKLDEAYINLWNSIDIDFEAFNYYEQNKSYSVFEVNYDSLASTPGNLTISKAKSKYIVKVYKNICNKGYFAKNLKQMKDFLKNGDVQPGMVASLKPLRVFVYSDEFDGGVMLKYPDEFVDYFKLSVNQKLIFINLYWHKALFSYRYDLLLGKNPTKEFRDLIPLSALFLSDDEEKIQAHISNIEEEVWGTVEETVKKYIDKYGDYAREGMEYFIQEK